MTDSRESIRPGAIGSRTAEQSPASRKPYRSPDIRRLGDVRKSTLKSGGRVDNRANPSRP